MALIDKLSAIGNAIREKNGTSDLIPLADMPQAILDISGGGETSLADMVYSHYGVRKKEYPYCAISFNTFQKKVFVYFATTITCASASSNLQLNAPYLMGSESYSSYSDFDNVEGAIQFAFDNIKSLTETTSGFQIITKSNTKSYINFDKGVFIGTVYEIPSGSSNGTEEIENLIDNSGVLDITEGSVTEKVEQLIDKADELDVFQSVTTIIFDKTTFPSKEKVNISLPNISNLENKFSTWNKEPIPTIDELILTAPKAKSISMLFYYCNSFRKIVLKLSNDIANMRYAFGPTNSIEEITLYFSTENVTNFNNCFGNTPIKTIEGTLDFSSAIDVANMFSGCGNLENVTFKPNTLSISISLANSSKLTSTSVDSIINGLKTLEEGATAQTLTLSKSIVLTDEQKANIQAKRWTLVQ